MMPPSVTDNLLCGTRAAPQQVHARRRPRRFSQFVQSQGSITSPSASDPIPPLSSRGDQPFSARVPCSWGQLGYHSWKCQSTQDSDLSYFSESSRHQARQEAADPSVFHGSCQYTPPSSNIFLGSGKPLAVILPNSKEEEMPLETDYPQTQGIQVDLRLVIKAATDSQCVQFRHVILKSREKCGCPWRGSSPCTEVSCQGVHRSCAWHSNPGPCRPGPPPWFSHLNHTQPQMCWHSGSSRVSGNDTSTRLC